MPPFQGVYVCQAIVLFLVGGRRMGHAAEPRKADVDDDDDQHR